MGAYESQYRRSIEDPDTFWAEAARAVDWTRRPDRVLDDSNPPFYRWFTGGELNTCHNALDRHADGGRGQQAALIYDSPVTGVQRTLTYGELRDEVARFAGALVALGVTKGDTVIIYLPMVPEAVVAMLACARIGAIHSVVFGGFAPHELAIRIDDARPKVIVSASCGIEVQRVIEYKPLLDLAIEAATHKPEHCVILQRTGATASGTPLPAAPLTPGRDHDWHEVVAAASPAGCVPVAATDPLYVLYTSGTTGKPKGVVRDNGGHAVALRWSMPNVYDTHPGEVFWAASDVGWVVGHSYIVYAPLLTGCTTVLYEGKPVGTPDPGAFWRVLGEHGVKTLFTAPTAFRAIKKEDPSGSHLAGHDLSRFRYLFLAGERLDPDTYHWAENLLDRPVIDHWWQTESGWPIVANCMGLEPLPREARLADQAGARVPREGPRPGDRGRAARRRRRCGGHRAAPPAGHAAHVVGRRRSVRGELPVDVPRPLHDRRRRLPGRRRLPVRDGPHRRRDQRGRASAVDRRDGGGASPPTRPSRSAPSSGWPTSSRVRCRPASWC